VDRCALFVDAGYVLGDGAMAVHGTRNRDSVSWDYSRVLQVLSNVARDRTGLPLLRCYWYEATVEGRRTTEHETLADLPGVKLRLGRMRPGRREGVESEIHRDLTTLARNRAISDALVVSADEDLAQVISDVQDLGIRVILAHIPGNASWTIAAALRQECDDVVEISQAQLRPAVELVVGAEPVGEDERHAVPAYAQRAPANGHGPPGALAHRQALPVGSHAAQPAIYTGPVIAEYQRAAQPAIGQPAAANSAGPAAGGPAPAAGQQGPAVPGNAGRPGTAAAQAPPAPMTAQPGAAVQPGTPSAGVPGQPAGTGQPGMPGQPGLSNGLAGQPATPAQPGLTAPAGTPPGLAGQPGMQPGQPAGPGQPVSHSAATMPVAQPAPGLPPQGQQAPRIGHHAAPGPSPDSAAPAGSLPAVHGHHEFPPQQPAPPGAAGITQPYQTPAAVAGQQGLPQGMAPSGMAGPGMAPPGMAGQPGAAAYQTAPPAPAGQAPTGSRLAPATPPGPAQPGPAGQQSSPAPRPYLPGPPARLPAGPQDQRAAQPYPAGHPDGGAGGPYVPQQGPHSGPQPAAQPVPQPVAVSLADAVQAAHGEGFSFGQVVARDAPALWLEAVLARKPRMPSDLEARLLQDSSLPIDSLLHDEVRHALRRGFWDALERVRH
jgi:hypothetical protein